MWWLTLFKSSDIFWAIYNIALCKCYTLRLGQTFARIARLGHYMCRFSDFFNRRFRTSIYPLKIMISHHLFYRLLCCCLLLLWAKRFLAITTAVRISCFCTYWLYILWYLGLMLDAKFSSDTFDSFIISVSLRCNPWKLFTRKIITFNWHWVMISTAEIIYDISTLVIWLCMVLWLLLLGLKVWSVLLCIGRFEILLRLITI